MIEELPKRIQENKENIVPKIEGKEDEEIKKAVSELIEIFNNLDRQDIQREQFLEELEKKLPRGVPPEILNFVIAGVLDEYHKKIFPCKQKEVKEETKRLPETSGHSWGRCALLRYEASRLYETNWRIGSLISHLINYTVDDYVKRELANGKQIEKINILIININLKEIGKDCRINNIGFRLNNKKCVIKIEGDVGDLLGAEIKEGIIELNGNAKSFVGDRGEGGKIIINGNTGDRTGRGIKGTEIIVNGNTGDCTGAEMKDGIIFVNGCPGTCTGAEMEGGTIIVKEIEEKNIHHSVFDEKNKGKFLVGVGENQRQLWPPQEKIS